MYNCSDLNLEIAFCPLHEIFLGRFCFASFLSKNMLSKCVFGYFRPTFFHIVPILNWQETLFRQHDFLGLGGCSEKMDGQIHFLQTFPELQRLQPFLSSCTQGVKALGRQNERKFFYDMLALTSIFGLCFMSVCLIKSNCYSLIYSSLLL